MEIERNKDFFSFSTEARILRILDLRLIFNNYTNYVDINCIIQT